jgi:hypothetical protein
MRQPKISKTSTIRYKGFEIDPLAELHGEGNGWSCVPLGQQAGFEVYPADIDEPKVDEFFETLEAAKAWIDAQEGR